MWHSSMAASSSCSCKLTDSFTFGEFPSFFIIFLENRKHILLNENENFLQNTLKEHKEYGFNSTNL
jgi:hypothetical protein